VRAYLSEAQWERGLSAIREAASLWRELQNLPMLTDSLATLALFYLFTGHYDEAIEAAEEARQLSRSIHNKWGEAYSQYGVGRVYWDRGDSERAIAVMEESIRLSYEAGFLSPQVNTRCDLALVYASLGAVQTGIELASEAVRTAQAHLWSYQALPQAVLCMLYLQQDDPAQAEAALRQAQADFDVQSVVVKPTVYEASIRYAISRQDYRQAVEVSTEYIEYLQKFRTTYQLAEILYLRGRALLASCRALEAQADLWEANRLASQMGARRIQWQILAALGDLAALEGQVAQAADLRQQAREIVDYIATHTPGSLRASFLATPAVQSTLTA
jgi:tetratricopeptide (TPR) repeat protein